MLIDTEILFMKTLLLTFAILLSSCAMKPSRILRKDVPESEVAQDNAICRGQAQLVQTCDYAYRGTFMEGAMIQKKQDEVYELCLTGKGYK